MKVLLDAHVGHLFRESLSDALGLPDCVYRAADFGWATLRNGALQKAASAGGFTHLITYDKDMANKHPPHIPVIATDNPSHGNAGREQGVLSLETIRTYTVSAATAIAERLLRDPPTRAGYFGIPIPGCKSSAALQLIINECHKQHPDHKANRRRLAIARQAAKKEPQDRRRGGHGR